MSVRRGWAVWLLAASLGSAPAAAPGVAKPADADEVAEIASTAGWLGLFLEDEPDGGARVVAVSRGGPAEAAGLRGGDLLLSVNGKPVTNRLSVRRALGPLEAGERIAVELLRDGRVERLEVVAARPSIPLPGTGTPEALPDTLLLRRGGVRLLRVGIDAVVIPADLRRFYGAPADSGVLVSSVQGGSPAAAAGIRVGDVVVRASSRAVRTPTDLEIALGASGAAAPLRLEIVRHRAPLEIRLFDSGEGDAPRAARAKAIEEEIAAIERRLHELELELERLRQDR